LSRRTLTDAQWARIEGHLPGRDGLPGRSGTDNRLFAKVKADVGASHPTTMPQQRAVGNPMSGGEH